MLDGVSKLADQFSDSAKTPLLKPNSLANLLSDFKHVS